MFTVISDSDRGKIAVALPTSVSITGSYLIRIRDICLKSC